MKKSIFGLRSLIFGAASVSALDADGSGAGLITELRVKRHTRGGGGGGGRREFKTGKFI